MLKMNKYSAEKREKIAQIIRINHAGEYAAKRIYQGQLKFIKDPEAKKIIEKMAQNEEEHLNYFEKKLIERGTRPTCLYPVVNICAYALGAVTAILGKEAAMACTTAVEEVIADHYQEQLTTLDNAEDELKKNIAKIRDEEIAHKDTGFTHDAINAPGYDLLSSIIKFGCKSAIKLVKYV
jgi:ubiquinone biosynthesis monooxygenase Coq7